MIDKTISAGRVGYTRYEFNRIFCIYSRHVYTGLFRDFSFTDMNGKYYISFRESADTIPLVTIEKRHLGLDRHLFVATTPGPRGMLSTIARSEKFDAFITQLSNAVDHFALTRVTQNTTHRNG